MIGTLACCPWYALLINQLTIIIIMNYCIIHRSRADKRIRDQIVANLAKMRTLLFYNLLLLCGLGGIVLAGNSSGSSCNISLVSVPELCLTTQETAVRLHSQVLNFTLAENGSLVLKPLPATRQVNLEVEDGSGRLKTWSNLANSFVDTVRSGSLPYGTILYVRCVIDSIF